jgi:hypothetical protein
MIKVSNGHSEEWMQKRLLVLQDVTGRSPDAEKTGRARFLGEAASLPVYSSYSQYLLGSFKSFVSRRPSRPARLAFSTAAAVCLMLALLLVSSGTVVYAAQGSQPNQILYPVKLFSEDVRLRLAVKPQSQFQLNLTFADRRLDEIDKLAQSGQDAGVQVTDRLQNELNAALDSAASLENEGAVKALENIQANLQQHEDQLLKLQSQANPHAVANYTRVVVMLQQKVNLAEQGVKDPQSIHQLLQQQQKQDKKTAGATPTPTIVVNNAQEATSTPAMAAATEPENNAAQCSDQGKGNNGNGNGNGNAGRCDEPDTQLTPKPAQPAAATSAGKPTNPNKPDNPDKPTKNPPEKGNKGGNGHKK